MVAAVGVAANSVPVAAAAAAPACTDVAPTEDDAAAMAAACGRSVVADSTRTQTTQVTVHPDGRRTFESAVVPQRVRRNGAWVGVDLGLQRGADGRWRPGAAVADVAFSGGGTGPLVTLTRDGKTMTMSWPGGALPAPVASADTVTYPNVLPDVDLVVRATDTGFSHVLAVKTAAAAANPKLRAVEFALGGDAQVGPGADGALRAVAGRQLLATAEPAVMWDSRTSRTAPRDRQPARSAAGSRSTAAVAGDAASVAKVDVALSGRNLVLRPDLKLLQAPDAVYPVFIDPLWSVGKPKWAYATNNNSSNTDYTVARVGLNPDTGALWRSFFEFSTTANNVSLKGKHIESAYVDMKLTHSWSCGNTVSSMYRTSVINATMKATYSKMSLLAFSDDASGHANEAGGCSDSPQDDMIMKYMSNAVTAQVQSAATANANTITFGFTARDANGAGESTQDRWKKFVPGSAILHVEYDTRPTAPNTLQVAGVVCPATGVLTIGTTTPTFSAMFPDADKDDSLTGRFEWIKVPAGGMTAVTDTSPTRETAPPNKTGVSPNTRATSNSVTALPNVTYAVRAMSTDRSPYFMTSPWSPWCQFKLDNTKPVVTVTVVTAPAGPGQAGTFRIQSADTDVTKFKYGWGAATTEVTAQGTSPRYAQVTVTVPKFGRNVLNVSAVDATLNEGVNTVEFTVGRPKPPLARWGLETYPGVNQTAALADQAPSLAGDTPLTPLNMSWTDDVHLVDGQTATFNGSSSRVFNDAPLIDPTKSFSVAAWVKLGNVGDPLPTGAKIAVVQDGDLNDSFVLGYWGDTVKKWGMWLHTSDTPSPAETGLAYSSVPVTMGVWTHLAGVYDAASGKTTIYVNGVAAGSATVTGLQAWPLRSHISIGREYHNGNLTNFWSGQIADVQVYDRVLVPHDFTGQLATDPFSGGFDEPGMVTPLEVAAWDFSAATPCYVTDLRDTCEAPDGRAWNRWLALSRGAAPGAGRPGSAVGIELDREYFPEEGYVEVSSEYGRSAYKTGTTTRDGQEFTTWQNTPVLRTDQSFTVSAWARLDVDTGNYAVVSQRGTVESAFWVKYQGSLGTWQFCLTDEDVNPYVSSCVTAAQAQAVNDWAHLTAVYDAVRNEMRLYLNGQLSQTKTVPFAPFNATGPLTIGRTLWHGSDADVFVGGIDDVQAWQGAMTDAQVLTLHESQVQQP